MAGKNSHTATATAPDFTALLSAFAACCLFILLSAALIPYAGIQDDEALFATPWYEGVGREFRIRMFQHDVPLMIMSYLGTLKTLIYWPLLHWFGSGVWVVRGPMLLAGAVTVFAFYHLVRTASHGSALAAALAALLLATDPTFVLTNTFDWGPVALEHVLFVTACFLLARFGTRQSRAWTLVVGFFLLGLALWDKALFFWSLSGAIMGTLIVFRTELSHCLSPRNVGIAVAGFLLGALPLVLFNLRQPNATLGQNAHIDTSSFAAKLYQLKSAANGSSLFGIIASEESDGLQKPVTSLRGRAALWIHDLFGEHRETGFYYVFGVLLVVVPLWWRSRAARFSLVFLAVAWALMALTKDAGGAAHHVVLLWPFPMLFAAAAIAAIPWRWAAVLSGTALIAMNLLVLNQYLLQFERDGAAGNFTDALFPLSQSLGQRPDQTLFVTDWGILYTMELAHQGRLHLRPANDPLMTDSPSPIEQAQIRAMLDAPGAVFVGHVPKREVYQGVRERLDGFASAAGYRKQMLEIIPDSNGRPVFEIFHYQRPPGGV